MQQPHTKSRHDLDPLQQLLARVAERQYTSPQNLAAVLRYAIEHGGPARVRRLMGTVQAHIPRAGSFAELDALLELLDVAASYLARVAAEGEAVRVHQRWLLARKEKA